MGKGNKEARVIGQEAGRTGKRRKDCSKFNVPSSGKKADELTSETTLRLGPCPVRLSFFDTMRHAPCAMLILACLCLIPSAAIAGAAPVTKTVVILMQSGSAHDISSKAARAEFTVEVVSEKADKQKGLSGRDSLPADAGMLFVIGPEDSHFFWMKDMKFPIDIIAVDRSMRVVEILRDLQPCTQCPIYSVSESTAYALEVNAGTAEKYGISPGDTFVFGKE